MTSTSKLRPAGRLAGPGLPGSRRRNNPPPPSVFKIFRILQESGPANRSDGGGGVISNSSDICLVKAVWKNSPNEKFSKVFPVLAGSLFDRREYFIVNARYWIRYTYSVRSIGTASMSPRLPSGAVSTSMGYRVILNQLLFSCDSGF